MTWGGIERFDSNTGQFTSGRFNGSSVTGTLTIGSGVGTYGATGASSTFFYIDASGGDPANGTYVALDLDSFTAPVGATFLGYNPCFIKDANNILMAESGPVVGGPANTYSYRINTFIGGTRTIWGSVVTLTQTPPYRTAISIEAKTLCFYTYNAGVWTKQISIDVSSVIDLTVPANLVGYRPGFAPWCDAANPTLVYDNLQWGPIADLANSQFFPPTGLGDVIVPGPAVTLSWVASVPFPGTSLTQPPQYVVYRNGAQIGVVTAAGVTQYNDATVLSGQTYSYTVAAADSFGNPISAQSLPLSVSTAPVFLTMKFAPAKTFKPIMLANVKGIKPRIYVPIQNNTVSTKQ